MADTAAMERETAGADGATIHRDERVTLATLDPALDTHPKWLVHNAKRFRDRPAMRHKDYGIWQEWTWAQMAAEVRAFALGLRALGLQRGDRVAVVGTNRPRMYWTFIAAQALGAVPVPVYADSVADEMSYVIDHAGARFAVVQDQEQVDKMLAMRAGETATPVPGLEAIIYDETRGLRDYDEPGLHSFADVQAMGREGPDTYADEVAAGRGSDLAVMLYTSGTTGRPKGVMLTHANLLLSALNANAFDRFDEHDEIVAYLPLAWVGDHVFSVSQALTAGYTVCCPEGMETVESDRREIAPTYFFAPPRVFEDLLTRVMVRMEDASAPKRRMFHAFLDHAKKVGEPILNGERVGAWDRAKYALGEALVYGPLKNRMGFTKLKTGYTAGEAIGPEIFQFYRSLGLNLKQLYGQTEASVYITQQPDGEIGADSVGVPSPGVELKIGEDGEVRYRSPGVFQAYYRNDESTADTKDAEGWVRTGDAGVIDRRGHLRIIDRAKDVGRMADGSLFAPKYVENKLKFFPDIKEAVAFGDGRPFCAAFINLDLTSVGNWAERNNVAYASYQELANHPRVYETMKAHVARVNRDLSRDELMSAAQIRRFLVLHKELDPDDGELTRTQKVRRGFIAERYGELIEALYDGTEEKDVATEVTYEDGRKGVIRARVRIVDAEVFGVGVREAAE